MRTPIADHDFEARDDCSLCGLGPDDHPQEDDTAALDLAALLRSLDDETVTNIVAAYEAAANGFTSYAPSAAQRAAMRDALAAAAQKAGQS